MEIIFRLHCHKDKEKQIFIVHCGAGISRSGAVATFINDLYGNSYKEFFNDNRHIQPNFTILRRLRQEYNKKYPNTFYQ
jgi:predicted protein tyrosine phosphatase